MIAEAGRSHTDRRQDQRPAGGLYLHIPFCRRICSYCHFARTEQHDAAARSRLISAMIAEFELRRAACASLRAGRRPLRSVYLGGGTPSLLAVAEMSRLLAGTAQRLPAVTDCEVTAEANPESFSPELAAAWRQAGINRVSLGIQSLDDRVLRLLGRSCDAATGRRALAVACRSFDRVAADWILGPGLVRGQLLTELAEAVATGVQHVSLYILERLTGTPLGAAVARGEVILPGEAEVEELYLAAVDRLQELGLVQYEVANFALPGAESRHNQGYWSGRPYLGIGPSAHGYWGRRRYANTADIAAYQQQVAAGSLPEASVDRLDLCARRLEGVILPLRRASGVPLARLPLAGLDLQQGRADGLWWVAGDRLRLTARGFLRIDAIEEYLTRHLQD